MLGNRKMWVLSTLAILALVVVGLCVPAASRATTMQSQNYSVYFSQIGGYQILSSSGSASERYQVISIDNTGVNPTPPNPPKSKNDRRDHIEEVRPGLGGTIENTNTNGTPPPTSGTPAPSTSTTSAVVASFAWLRRWTSIIIMMLTAFLLSVLVEKLQTKKRKQLLQ